MNAFDSWSRRRFMGMVAAGATALAARGALAEELMKTPAQMEGPFYPDKLPLDTDNDLLIINDDLTQAVGEITYLSGQVLDVRGNPIRNAFQISTGGLSTSHTAGRNRKGPRRCHPAKAPTLHAITVASAAPRTPSAGTGPRPKMRIGSMHTLTTAAIKRRRPA